MEPFTYEEYRSLLAEFKQHQYEFARFNEISNNFDRPFVLLRHDIDMSLEAALRMAEIEAENRVRATYFFLLRTEHYNVFSKEGSQIVRNILEFGHALGLHFDCAAYGNDCGVDALAAACSREAGILETWLDRPVSVVSYHRPNALVMSGLPDLSSPRLHTYMKIFRTPITYLSDSRGQWSNGSPLASQAFRESRPLHVLVHPIWWGEHMASPEDRLAAFRRRRAETLDESLGKNCSVYKPEKDAR